MAIARVYFSAKRAYASCLIGLALAEALLYAIAGIAMRDPLASRPELFLALPVFAVILAITIRWLSGKFSVSREKGKIACHSPFPWAKKREINVAGARVSVTEDVIDRLLGTASIETRIGKGKESFGPFEKKDAVALGKEIGRDA